MITAGYHLSLQPGTRIEEYEILSVLGQGSFGITYLAEDTNLGARLAIKEYLPSDWAFRDSTQTVRPKNTDLEENFAKGQDAFLKEARVLARVTHPNIVKVRRFFRAHGTAYIAMDFVDGRNFGDVLKDDYPAGGYPSTALKQLLLALLDGIGALHETGIIHRDIKPGNVVIAANGSPILVDFGAARNFDRTMMQGMTVIVTPGYAPIEQYSDDGEQGPFTDIYALGALAYRAITGQPPDAPYKRLSHEGTTAQAAGAGKYPAGLLAAIDWAIAVQPHDRPQSAAALLARLREAPDEMPAAAQEEPTRILSDATVVLDPPSRRGGTQRKDALSAEAPSIRARSKTAAPALAVEPAPPAASTTAKPRRMRRIAIAVLALVVAASADVLFGLEPLTRKTIATAPSEPAKASADDAARKAAEDQAAAAALKAQQDAADAARAEAERQAAAKAEADREAAALKAQQDAAEAARVEADRQAAAKAEADRQAAAAAALKAQQDTAAKVAATKKAQAAAPAEAGNSPSRAADPRCTTILQTSQLMGTLSDDDRAYLKDHCH